MWSVDAVSIPVLHIADAAANKIKEMGINSIGLLGTKFTMEMDFYKGRLLEKYGIYVLIPNEKDRAIVNQIIYSELVVGEIKPESKREYLRIIDNMVRRGAEGIILGCTEIPLLIKQPDTDAPIFDTTYIHAEIAVEIALGERDF